MTLHFYGRFSLSLFREAIENHLLCFKAISLVRRWKTIVRRSEPIVRPSDAIESENKIESEHVTIVSECLTIVFRRPMNQIILKHNNIRLYTMDPFV